MSETDAVLRELVDKQDWTKVCPQSNRSQFEIPG
jgi:hypothetical protein